MVDISNESEGLVMDCGLEDCSRRLTVPVDLIRTFKIRDGKAEVTADARDKTCPRSDCGSVLAETVTANTTTIVWLRSRLDPTTPETHTEETALDNVIYVDF